MATNSALYARLASLIVARANCIKSGNAEWQANHEQSIRDLMDEYLPHGSGIDGQNTIDYDKSNGDRIVLGVSFHHMNDVGMYDGWTEHTITVRPSLAFGCDLTIGGRDRNGIKDYLGDIFSEALRQTVEAA